MTVDTDALRLIAIAALAATLSGCGCSGDGESSPSGKAPDGLATPSQEEVAPPRDEWADRMRDPKYLAKTDELHSRLNAALRRHHDARNDLERAIAAGANAQALSVYSNAVKAAAEDVQRVRAESQRVVAEQIGLENAQLERLEKDRVKTLNEKKEGGKGK